MDTISTQWFKLLLGLLAIFCLLSGRTELGVLFLLIGILVPLARRLVHPMDDPSPHTPSGTP